MGTDRAAKSPNPRIHFITEKQRLYFRRINILQKSTKKRLTDIIKNVKKMHLCFNQLFYFVP